MDQAPPRRVFPVPDFTRTHGYGRVALHALAEWMEMDDGSKYNHVLERIASQHDGPRDEAFDDKLSFATKRAVINDNPDEDAFWVCTDMLGSGAFGMVGLWERKNAHGQSTDRIAIKQVEQPGEDGMVEDYPRSGQRFPKEALIQAALQKKGAHSVLQLRNIKHFPRHNLWRYYLEYCPYGDLADVIAMYRNQNRLYLASRPCNFVPEAFLWQLLHDFASTLVKMQDTPFDFPMQQDDNSYILHLDVKPSNLFLGDFEAEQGVQGFPSVKIGDWGLAECTSLWDQDNSALLFCNGTRTWLPPEQRERNRYLIGGGSNTWDASPPWVDNIHGGAEYPYTAAHSIFAFGEVMMALMILDDGNELMENILWAVERREARTRRNNFRVVTPNHLSSLAEIRVPTPYSDNLKNVVCDMLVLDPDLRVPAPTLLAITSNTVRQLSAIQQNGQTGQYPKVFDDFYFGRYDSGRGNFLQSSQKGGGLIPRLVPEGNTGALGRAALPNFLGGSNDGDDGDDDDGDDNDDDDDGDYGAPLRLNRATHGQPRFEID